MSRLRSFKPKPNYFWSVLSVAGVLFLFGLFTLITLHSQDVMQNLKEDFQVVVEFEHGVESGQVQAVRKALAEEVTVRSESVVWISREEGLKQLSDELGKEILAADMPNPLSDVITFSLLAEAFDPGHIDALREKYLGQFDAVAGIYYQEGIIEQVIANLDKLSYFFLVSGIILAILALTLIHNSIRLSIYANRFLVRNMELVGASWGFIRRPFIWKGIRHGFTSALIALAGIVIFGFLILERIPELMDYLRFEYLLYLMGMVIMAGILIHIVSTFLVVTRFLRMREGALHM